MRIYVIINAVFVQRNVKRFLSMAINLTFNVLLQAAKKKNKKKKDKGKQVLNVEVNFGDDSEKQLLGEDSVIEEEYVINMLLYYYKVYIN